MRVFVGFGYKPEEEWVSTVVLPVLARMGIEVVEGKEIPGRLIDEVVEERIRSCDAMVGLLTRRDPTPDKDFETSAWVRRELKYAFDQGLPVVQVLERGVREPEELPSNLQRITYEPEQQGVLLRDLTRHIGEWVDGVATIRITPDSLARRLALSALHGTAFCNYTIQQGKVIKEGKAQLRGSGGGMFMTLLGFRPGTQAQVWVEVDGATWASDLADHTMPFTQIELRPT